MRTPVCDQHTTWPKRLCRGTVVSVHSCEKKVGLGIGRTRRSHGPTHQGRPCTGVRHSDTISVKYLLDFVACAHSHTRTLNKAENNNTNNTKNNNQTKNKHHTTNNKHHATQHHTTQHNHKQPYTPTHTRHQQHTTPAHHTHTWYRGTG